MSFRPWTLDTVRNRCIEEGDCWIWNQSLNSSGYPQACIHGACERVQRFVFRDLMGNELPPKHVVTQRCRNKACCAPKCQEAITYGERLRRTYENGARPLSAKERAHRRKRVIAQGWKVALDLVKAREIRGRGDESLADLAKAFGVHPKTIAKVRAGSTWNEGIAGSSVFNWRPA